MRAAGRLSWICRHDYFNWHSIFIAANSGYNHGFHLFFARSTIYFAHFFRSLLSIEVQWTFVFAYASLLARCDSSSRMRRQKKAASQNGDIPNKTMIFRNKYVDQIGYDSILRWSAYILWIVHICLCILLPIPLAHCTLLVQSGIVVCALQNPFLHILSVQYVLMCHVRFVGLAMKTIYCTAHGMLRSRKPISNDAVCFCSFQLLTVAWVSSSERVRVARAVVRL